MAAAHLQLVFKVTRNVLSVCHSLKEKRKKANKNMYNKISIVYRDFGTHEVKDSLTVYAYPVVLHGESSLE